jgi:1-acyl-sn-glycerol-3-phosphate acyltransferase
LLALTILFFGMFSAVTFSKAVACLSPRLGAVLWNLCHLIWMRGFVTVMGGKVDVTGSPPSVPCLLVSNHLGYLDILLLAAYASPIFVAKCEVAGWPLIGLLCRLLDTIFIDRNRKRDLPRVIEEIAASLRQGRAVVFFPEGTSTAGATVLPFKSPLFEPAVRNRIPVFYASLSYSLAENGPPADLSLCWWGEMTLAKHLYKLLQLPGFRARLCFGSEPLSGDNRKSLAASARYAVIRQFVPVVRDRRVSAFGLYNSEGSIGRAVRSI